jgi:hypothetical protein
MLAAGLNYPGVDPLAAIGIFTVAAVLLSLLFTRAFLAAGGAVLVAVIMHASFNAFSDTLTTTDHLSGNPLVVNPGGLVGIVLVWGRAGRARAHAPCVTISVDSRRTRSRRSIRRLRRKGSAGRLVCVTRRRPAV